MGNLGIHVAKVKFLESWRIFLLNPCDFFYILYRPNHARQFIPGWLTGLVDTAGLLTVLYRLYIEINNNNFYSTGKQYRIYSMRVYIEPKSLYKIRFKKTGLEFLFISHLKLPYKLWLLYLRYFTAVYSKKCLPGSYPYKCSLLWNACLVRILIGDVRVTVMNRVLLPPSSSSKVYGDLQRWRRKHDFCDI